MTLALGLLGEESLKRLHQHRAATAGMAGGTGSVVASGRGSIGSADADRPRTLSRTSRQRNAGRERDWGQKGDAEGKRVP